VPTEFIDETLEVVGVDDRSVEPFDLRKVDSPTW
jgi:hypothetical protein